MKLYLYITTQREAFKGAVGHGTDTMEQHFAVSSQRSFLLLQFTRSWEWAAGFSTTLDIILAQGQH